MRRLWTDSHAALARNGDIARVALGRMPIGPNALRIAEATMAILRAGGVPDRAVAWAVDVVGLYVAANAVEGAVHTANRQRRAATPRSTSPRWAATSPASRPTATRRSPR